MMRDIQPIFDERVRWHGGPIVVAGPCSAETQEQVLTTARELAEAGIGVYRAGVWKPRTRPGTFEGVGSPALEWLKKVKEETGMLTSTEVATRQHLEEALVHDVDILWLGARTTTNPFAVQEIADAIKESGKDVAVLVKNPVNPDLELWIGALQRLYNAGVRRLGLVHRGFSAYGNHIYRNEPQWAIPFEMRRRYPHIQMLCDPSHIGGKRELVGVLSQQALDMGYDGLIIESHCQPDKALSDSAQQLTPEQLREVLGSLSINTQTSPSEQLSMLRRRIDQCDEELLEILGRRMEVAREIGDLKLSNRMPVVQIGRHDEVLRNRAESGEKLGLDGGFIKRIMSVIHEESVRQQLRVLHEGRPQDK